MRCKTSTEIDGKFYPGLLVREDDIWHRNSLDARQAFHSYLSVDLGDAGYMHAEKWDFEGEQTSEADLRVFLIEQVKASGRLCPV
jgi:hypothetical protein